VLHCSRAATACLRACLATADCMPGHRALPLLPCSKGSAAPRTLSCTVRCAPRRSRLGSPLIESYLQQRRRW
jgi:hypothetical protein